MSWDMSDADLVDVNQEKCTRPLAPIVVRKQKFRSNPLRANRSTAENATRSTDGTEIT
jgi:hypothetical protein